MQISLTAIQLVQKETGPHSTAVIMDGLKAAPFKNRTLNNDLPLP
jgi:hypothetical protein